MFTKCSTRYIVLVAVAISTIPVTNGLKEYADKLPINKCKNKPKSEDITAIGHKKGVEGGENTEFGKAFSSANNEWTPELCKLKSLDSEHTNGEMLCDPCCSGPGTASEDLELMKPGTCKTSSDGSGGPGSVKPSPSTGTPSTGTPGTGTPSTGTPSTGSLTPNVYSNDVKCKAKEPKAPSPTPY